MHESPTLPAPEPTHEPRRHAVTIHVNERPVRLPEHVVTGLEIKRLAIEQGLAIQLDFILVEELGGGRTKVIGDDDPVRVTDQTRFLANDGDDNS